MGKRTSSVSLANFSRTKFDLGYAGENIHTQIVIDCTEVFTDYEDAEVTAVFRNQNGETYPHDVSTSGNYVTLTLDDTDTAVPGVLKMQLEFTDDEEIIKSAIGSGEILGSLQTDGSTPSPAERWAEALAAEFEDQIADAAETVTPVIVVDCGTISTLPVTLEAEGVTADYKAIAIELGTPTLMTSAMTVTTGADTVTLSGTKSSGSTTCVVTLIKATVTVEATEAEEEA